MEVFDPKEGIKQAPLVEVERDVSADLVNAEKIIRGLKEQMFIEDLIKLVQKTCALTNDEVYGIVQKVSAELKPEKEPITEPINA